MKLFTKNLLTAFVISTFLSISISSFEGNSAEASDLSAPVEYYVTDTIKVELKSVLNEQTSEGTRIGVVYYLSNQGNQVTGPPEYEVRVKTSDGLDYTLQPSAANVDKILPKEKIELSYMLIVNREEPFSLTEISWVDANPFVYPKKEKTELTIPVLEQEWNGDGSTISKPEMIKQWGDAFTIPMQSSSLEFKTENLVKHRTPKGVVILATLLVENKGTLKQTIPDFRIDGKSAKKVFNGKRAGQENVTIEPGAKQYIYYAIPLDNDEQLLSLNILTPESFATEDKKTINYTVGRLNIQLPGGGQAIYPAIPYQRGTLIRFDPLSKLIPANVFVSLQEFQMHESDGEQYKTVVAKFNVLNRTDNMAAAPNFQAELTGNDGSSYMGTRQNLTIKTLIPNVSYVMYFYFVIPTSEKGDQFILNLMDGDSAAPYQIPIASLQTAIQTNENSRISLYPFEVKLNSWNIETRFDAGGLTYSNKLILDMDILQEKSVVDQNFTKMQVDVLDKEGKVLTSEALSFTGAERLTRGERIISFKSQRYEYNYTFKIYEVVETPFGVAKRHLKTVQQ